MKKKLLLGTTIAMGAIMIVRSLKNMPKKAEPVKDFDLYDFLGNWYEIARLDNRFEHQLDNVMTNYSVKKNGNIRIINSGFNTIEKQWEEVEGVGKFRGSEQVGALKVRFAVPFYEGYNIIAIDEHYNHALIAGRNLNYLWILSREKDLPPAIKEKYMKLSELIGYNVSKLVWTIHDLENPLEKRNTFNEEV